MHHKSHYRPSLFATLKEVLCGKAVSRTLTNLFWRQTSPVWGNILDIGSGGGRASHYRFLPLVPGARVQTLDASPKSGAHFVLDITKEPVPLADGSQNFVFLFNVLEHLKEHEFVLTEIHRLLGSGGKLIGTIPFLINVHRDPEDYVRLTDTALHDLFTSHGFSVERIEPIGRGPFLAAYEQFDMLMWSPLHLLFLPIIWGLDGLLSLVRPKRDFAGQFPLAYNFVVEKRV
ncbi:MAG: class I SAM-dependent methyltransferase [bacterium]|nr:class I SAM-dependent methyltransferase [bacterium]